TVNEFAEEMETAYRRAVAANPETVGAGAYEVTVAGLAPPFMQATAAAQPARQQTAVPVAAATQAAGQATAAATVPSALSNRRKALAIAGLFILAVMSAIYFLRSKPVAAPQKVAADTVPA